MTYLDELHLKSLTRGVLMDTELNIPKGTDLNREANDKIWSNINWMSTFCLIEKNGSLPITEISKLIGISNNEVLHILEGLEKIGAIRRNLKGYEQTTTLLKRNKSFKNKQEILEDFVISSEQVVNRILETSSSDKHQTRSIVYNSSSHVVKKLYEKIQNAIEEFKIESDNSKESWDGVYALSIALADLTSKEAM